MADLKDEEIEAILLEESSDSETEDNLEAVDNEDSSSSDVEDTDIGLENVDQELQNIFSASSSTASVSAPSSKRPRMDDESVVASTSSQHLTSKSQLSIVPMGNHGYVLEVSCNEIKGKGQKDQFIWQTKPVHSASGKLPGRNIIHIQPGPTSLARNASSPIECFQLLFTTDILGKILLHTNKEIEKQRLKYKSKNKSTYTLLRKEELDAFMGLIILSAVLKSNHLSVEILFDTRYSGEIFRATMSKQRFKFIMNCLRFDDRDSRAVRRNQTKFAPISEIWKMLIDRCRSVYKPGSYCTIDEQLVGFRGRCPFRMYIPNKPNKYGIKIVMICDANTKYMFDAEPYLGKEMNVGTTSLAEYYVLKLVESIKGSNRNLTMDNWFTSIPLAKKLLGHYKITVVGTIKKKQA